MEIKVGEYVRIKSGKIGRVISIEIDKDFDWVETTLDKGYVEPKTNIVKHSKNIIDLVEKGDYVNGYKVISIDYDVIDDKTECIELDLNNNYQYNFISANQIKTIATKEQMASIEYKVEENK